MAGFIKNISKISIVMAVLPTLAFGVQQPNPRGSAKSAANLHDVESSASVRRSAMSVISRAVNPRLSRTVVSRSVSARSASDARTARSAINSTKTRAAAKPTFARTGTTTNVKKSNAKTSRAASARATAVFNDVTKIGGGYSNCRDAYATCMDQFCANANDTYRRCFCSDRFTDFRDSESGLDEALKSLAQFQDNNLDAVDKTAAEVNAMYTATAGEAAVKRDTSASQKLLDSIGEVLSGKKKTTTKKASQTNLVTLGVLNFSGDNAADPWGSTASAFGMNSTNVNMSELEGKELYDNAMQQCVEITRDSCGNDAMFNLARSAYSIMVTQDCNLYEKNINAKKASVEETVRTMEKYLREARLEEYRAHNSQDVNECLTLVEEAMRKPTACGPKYEKCMDYTGLYINSTTGEPIYTQALFGLNNLIKLDGSTDVLGANSQFDKWLDERKTFAATALDTCRDKSDIVWQEFKRSALIQIAQAQDEKIQEVKDSCVVTIKECYDSKSGSLKQLDTTTTQSTEAISAVAARGMCYDRVQACAALYGDPDGCEYDDATKKLTPVNGKKCGLQSLLTFVDTVDAVKVAEGCETALTKYARELCPDTKLTDSEGKETGEVIPYGECKTKPRREVQAAMDLRMKTFCAQDLVAQDESNTLQSQSAFNADIMNQLVKTIYDDMGLLFTAGCESEGGVWVDAEALSNPKPSVLVQGFYKKYYGVTINRSEQAQELNLIETGWCINGEGRARCEALGSYVENYNEETGECELTDNWYRDMCETLGGTWANEQCLINSGGAAVEFEDATTTASTDLSAVKTDTKISNAKLPVSSLAELKLTKPSINAKRLNLD